MYAPIGFSLIALAWLVPNTSQPWISFWMEVVAFLGISIVLFKTLISNRIFYSRNDVIIISILIATLILDFFHKDNNYIGDYIIGFIYIYAFFSAKLIGKSIEKNPDIFFYTTAAAAVLSSLIVIAQWLQIDLDRLYFKEVPPLSRPFANTGQPNHLGTLLSLGIISIMALSDKIKISKLSLYFLLLILTFSSSLTQSRTAGLQIICTAIIVIIFSKIKKINLSIIPSSAVVIFFVFFTTYQPSLNRLLFLEQIRPIGATTLKDSRLDHWTSMLEAISHKPWGGYGWLHSVEAQLTGTNYGIKAAIFPYTHNIILDLIIWFGIPIAALLIFFTLKEIILIIKNIQTSNQILALAGFSTFLIHCLLEYPFTYMHILIPGGIFFGIAGNYQSAPKNKKSYFLKYVTYAATSILATIILIEYTNLEKTATALRFKYAGIFGNIPVDPIKASPLMNQLTAYINTAYQLPSNSISTNEVHDYEISANRYGTQRLLFHSALASGFYGDEEKSKKQLKNICRIHTKEACDFSKSEWSRYQIEYPQTIGIIEFPS